MSARQPLSSVSYMGRKGWFDDMHLFSVSQANMNHHPASIDPRDNRRVDQYDTKRHAIASKKCGTILKPDAATTQIECQTLDTFGSSIYHGSVNSHLRIPHFAPHHEEFLNCTVTVSVPTTHTRGELKTCSALNLPPTTCAPSVESTSTLSNAVFNTPGERMASQPCQPHARILDISDFVPLAHIGKGAHGRVLLVHDKVSQQDLALKIIEKDTLHLTSYPRIFEEQLVGRKLLECSWAVGLEGSFQDQEYFYYLSKYHGGGDLTKLVRQCGKLPFSVARQYAAELIVAVGELHRRQIMHRDIKPDNILLDEEGHLLLADFGVSRSFHNPQLRSWEQSRGWARYTTRSKPRPLCSSHQSRPARDDTCTPCGTPGFMAPETFGMNHYSYEADIWSAGVVIHYLLTGRLPFGMIPARQTYRELSARTKALKLEFGLDERVPGYARSLLRRMLEKDPAHRLSLSEVKGHQFFSGIDWHMIAERKAAIESPFVHSYLREKATNLPTQQGVILTTGAPYERGISPFPWFEYASPALLKPEPPALDIYDADELTLYVPPSARRKDGLIERLKGLWRYNHIPTQSSH